MLNQRLDQKLLQKLSPQQIQLIKLLEVPTIELEQRIKRELEENPTLEEGREEDEENMDEENHEQEDDDEFTLEDYLNEEDIPSYRLNANNHSKDDEKKEIPLSIGASFYESLYDQLGLKKLSEEEYDLAKYIIGNIDEDGYLRREIPMIADDLMFRQNISVSDEELEEILKIIQSFDPPGVGCRDLQECLILQLERKDMENKAVKTAYEILNNNFEEFTKKHYNKLTAKYGITEQDLKLVLEEIIKLNPKPGSSFVSPGSRPTQHITPDFLLDFEDGQLKLSLNSRNAPELKVSRTYVNMLEDYANNKSNQSQEQKDTVQFIRQKLDSAKWFIDAIKQRQQTLFKTMNAILEFQKEYFQEGDIKSLRPMILKDIAEKTELDISTISRVANSKYIQTHFGIFPLKSFFSEAMQTTEGEDVSSKEIKAIMEELIGQEDKRKPLTDDKLSDLLNEKGYRIARRTVAKYREQMGIPVGRMRKEL
ncbi:MAG: RNA polymerase factor sigma-54 [Bacteroidales bacterium]|nr:RNA polymerase factor sigma-54 [Bacteroidales bacterium]